MMRFVVGGIATVVPGIIANQFGAVIGGLFLAIPSILYASVTLIKKHETEKKERVGLPVGERARHAVALDTTGASLGGIGLVTFAVVVWCCLTAYGLAATLTMATIVWGLVSLITWITWRFVRNSLRPKTHR
jgi:hypothetical protein